MAKSYRILKIHLFQQSYIVSNSSPPQIPKIINKIKPKSMEAFSSIEGRKTSVNSHPLNDISFAPEIRKELSSEAELHPTQLNFATPLEIT